MERRCRRGTGRLRRARTQWLDDPGPDTLVSLAPGVLACASCRLVRAKPAGTLADRRGASTTGLARAHRRLHRFLYFAAPRHRSRQAVPSRQFIAAEL